MGFLAPSTVYSPRTLLSAKQASPIAAAPGIRSWDRSLSSGPASCVATLSIPAALGGVQCIQSSSSEEQEVRSPDTTRPVETVLPSRTPEGARAGRLVPAYFDVWRKPASSGCTSRSSHVVLPRRPCRDAAEATRSSWPSQDALARVSNGSARTEVLAPPFPQPNFPPGRSRTFRGAAFGALSSVVRTRVPGPKSARRPVVTSRRARPKPCVSRSLFRGALVRRPDLGARTEVRAPPRRDFPSRSAEALRFEEPSPGPNQSVASQAQVLGPKPLRRPSAAVPSLRDTRPRTLVGCRLGAFACVPRGCP